MCTMTFKDKWRKRIAQRKFGKPKYAKPVTKHEVKHKVSVLFRSLETQTCILLGSF